jgi:ComF family protein
VWAPLAYEDAARAMVRALKFRGALGLAPRMAAVIAANAHPATWQVGPLVPVPISRARRRRRGFNQAEALAGALSSRVGVDVLDCLRRPGTARPQVGLGRVDRLGALEGMIELRRGAAVPAGAVLVDDVVTTGATLAACARVLRAAGCVEVAGVAYARTPAR